jgi:hypothetical protein
VARAKAVPVVGSQRTVLSQDSHRNGDMIVLKFKDDHNFA